MTTQAVVPQRSENISNHLVRVGNGVCNKACHNSTLYIHKYKHCRQDNYVRKQSMEKAKPHFCSRSGFLAIFLESVRGYIVSTADKDCEELFCSRLHVCLHEDAEPPNLLVQAATEHCILAQHNCKKICWKTSVTGEAQRLSSTSGRNKQISWDKMEQGAQGRASLFSHSSFSSHSHFLPPTSLHLRHFSLEEFFLFCSVICSWDRLFLKRILHHGRSYKSQTIATATSKEF